MADLRTVLIGLLLVAYSSAAYQPFVYAGRFPIIYLIDFSYTPTDYGYQLLYRTNDGILREQQAYLPRSELQGQRNAEDGNGDTLGSSMKRRQKSSKLPLKNRKVSPKLLSSLAG